MSFQIKHLKNNRIKVVQVNPSVPSPTQCQYDYIGGKINTKTLQSMIKNGYSKKPQSVDKVDGYDLDKELSGTRAQVYHNKDTNHLVINHRGTKGLSDVMTDLQLMVGYKNGKRFQHGKKVTDDAIKKYDTDNITVSGHSLGAQVAKEANKDHQKELISVNPAIVPNDLLNVQKKNETVIRSELDPISALHSISPFASKSRTINIKAKTMNPLTEHKSGVLDRITDENVGV
jgi:predicted esterase YcpF (UPF0227 family)